MSLSTIGSKSGSGPSGSKSRELAAPHLLEHRDRSRAADLLVADVSRLVLRLGIGVTEDERRCRKNLELIGISTERPRPVLHIGVIPLAVLERPVQGEQGVGVPGAEPTALVGVAGLQQYRMALRPGRQRRETAHVELRTRVFDAADPIRIDVDLGGDVGNDGVGRPAVPELAGHGEELLGPPVAVGRLEKTSAAEVRPGERIR